MGTRRLVGPCYKGFLSNRGGNRPGASWREAWEKPTWLAQRWFQSLRLCSGYEGETQTTTRTESGAPAQGAHLEDAFTDGLKNSERVRKAVETFQGLVEVTATANERKYREFASKVLVHR